MVEKFIAEKNSKKRLGSTKTAGMTTFDNQVWTGTLYMGPTLTTVNVIFDTSSDWLVVEDTDCDTCSGENYDSSRFGKLINTDYVIREYGSIEFISLEYEDKVRILPSTCVNQ